MAIHYSRRIHQCPDPRLKAILVVGNEVIPEPKVRFPMLLDSQVIVKNVALATSKLFSSGSTLRRLIRTVKLHAGSNKRRSLLIYTSPLLVTFRADVSW